MTAEQQLERSVLEGKERDELNAIAQAMSLKTTSRTKKADIIDQILDATGVTSAASSNGDGEHDGANGTKPARRTRSVAAAAVDGDGASGDDGAESTGTAAPAEAEAAAPESTTATAAAPDGDSGPAVFVEPPELADGADPGPRQNGQGQGQSRGQGQTRQPQPPEPGQPGQPEPRQPGTSGNQGNQSDGDVGNRRSRRRRGRDRGQGGELQGGGGRSSPTRASWSR